MRVPSERSSYLISCHCSNNMAWYHVCSSSLGAGKRSEDEEHPYLLLTQCVARALRAQCAGVDALRAQEVLMMVQCMSQVWTTTTTTTQTHHLSSLWSTLIPVYEKSSPLPSPHLTSPHLTSPHHTTPHHTTPHHTTPHQSSPIHITTTSYY